jgi:hypothetical protein
LGWRAHALRDELVDRYLVDDLDDNDNDIDNVGAPAAVLTEPTAVYPAKVQ